MGHGTQHGPGGRYRVRFDRVQHVGFLGRAVRLERWEWISNADLQRGLAQLEGGTMAEFTAETFAKFDGAGKYLIFITATAAVNNDTITVPGITTVKGCYLMSTTGVVGTVTMATNVITVTNAGALLWSGLAWGT